MDSEHLGHNQRKHQQAFTGIASWYIYLARLFCIKLAAQRGLGKTFVEAIRD
jgi:hypothetical protein